MSIKEESVIKAATTRREKLRVIIDHALINSDDETTCKLSKKTVIRNAHPANIQKPSCFSHNYS